MEERKVVKGGELKAEPIAEGKEKFETKEWQKPTLEDVSEKIMAQPYIRFT